MLTQRRHLLAVLTAIAVLTSAYSSRATQTELIATPFTGADTSVHILLDDAGGDITVTLTVNEGLADLRGFFINIQDFSLLSGAQVFGADVTRFVFDDDDVINLRHGVNLRGGGSPCPCDLGVALGTPGIGRDDLSSTTFRIDAVGNLTLDNFAGELLGVRVTSVGAFDDVKDDKKDPTRNGSAKLVATIPDPIIPVPEPNPALLTAIGLLALGYASRKRRGWSARRT